MGKSKGNIVNIYDKETQERIANELEAYLSMINLVILENRSEKEIDDAVKHIEKKILQLRENKVEKVINLKKADNIKYSDDFGYTYDS